MAKKKITKPAAGGPVGTRAAAGGGTAGGPMDVGLLDQIVKLMSANDLNTVDLRDGGRRVILRRGPAAGPAVQYAMGPAPMMAAPPPAGPAQPPAAAAGGPASGGGGGAGRPPPTTSRASSRSRARWSARSTRPRSRGPRRW
jgi:hypothetical protein